MADSTETHATDVSPYLKQVRVRDYRSIRDARAEFKSGLNIIIGQNGAGKTNFLSLASRLIEPYLEQTDGAGSELKIVDEKEFIVSFQSPDLQNIGGVDFRPADRALLISISSNGKTASDTFLEEVFIKLENRALRYETTTVWYGNPLISLPLLDRTTSLSLTKAGKAIWRDTPPIGNYFSSSLLLGNVFWAMIRVWGARPYAESLHLSSQFDLLPMVRELVVQVIEFFLKQLRGVLAIYSPIKDIRLNPTWQAYANEVNREVLVTGLVLEYYIAGQWLPFIALSDGTKRLFYIISQIATRAVGSMGIRRPKIDLELSTRPRIIFLEEPELGIHPDQLQKLLSLIREVSKEHQVIMTTHSPQVLNMLTTKELDRITICELDPKKGTQFRKLSPAKRAKAKAYVQNDSYLSDFWLYSNLEAE